MARNICTIEGCGKIVHGQGYCKMHHLRWHRYGDPLFVKQYKGNISAAFWSRINKDGPLHPICGQCWLWTGGTMGRGYGALRSKGKQVIAHRYSWEIHFGNIPEGLKVLHRCDTPACVNPDHLFLGTDQDNADDKVAKGRQAFMKGEANPFSILTEEQVREIKRTYKGRCKINGANALAKKFKVTTATIGAIVEGRNWKHVVV